MSSLLQPRAGASYDDIRRHFSWSVPSHFNIGVACSDVHPAAAVAMIHARADGGVDRYTYGDLSRLSSSFANGLRSVGVAPGDRVAVVLPQSPLTAISHVAIYKLGAVVMPLSSLFGPDALLVRLRDSGARVVITDQASLPKVEECAPDLPDLERIVLSDGGTSARPSSTVDELVGAGSSSFAAAATRAEDPAFLIYTSGTTGGPKGALHAHRGLLGHLTGFELSHAYFPQPSDLFWTPADWAWIGGLMDALFPTLYYGRTILVADGPTAFDPQWTVDTIARHGVRNAFIPPTALKLMRHADVNVPAELQMRSIASGGESLGDEVLGWCREKLGLTVNEMYGQTECNYVIGNSSGLFDVRPGSMGKAYPGHDVVVLGEDGEPAPVGSSGDIAIRTPDPVAFLGYWQKPEQTRDKFSGDWLLTGDHAAIDEQGYFHYLGRRDDLINSSGYRIGPTEIESCLMRHPAVAMAAVVGVPDALRGEVIKACVVPRAGVDANEELARDIRGFVRSRLAAYQYPRIVEFIAEMPLTSTGKIRRMDLR